MWAFLIIVTPYLLRGLPVDTSPKAVDSSLTNLGKLVTFKPKL